MEKSTGERTVRLVKDRETKGTVRYAEEEPDNGLFLVGTLYVKKYWVKALSLNNNITLTIKA